MKKITLTIGIILTLVATGRVSFAESEVYTDKGDLSIQRCIAKGNIDFGAFLDSILYNDGFTDGILEPWRDVLTRNQCQSNDIYSLIKQEDKIRSAIRMAFMTCNNDTVAQLKKAYFKLMVEIYYARHIVDAGITVGLPVPAQVTIFKDAAVADRTKLYQDMSDKYVKDNFMSKADFDQLFLKLENKYASRKDQYSSCDKSAWTSVGEKWQEFTKFFSDGAGLKDAYKTIGAKAAGGGPSLKNELKSIKTVELFTTDESFGQYLSSWAQVNVNNLTPQGSLDEAKNFIDMHLGNGGGLSQQDFVSAKSNGEDIYLMEQDIQKIKTGFDGRYKIASDQSEELFLNSLDGRQTGGADDGLLEIINNSFSPLNDTLKFSKKILDRECKGSE
ncbi:hypothetical protein HZA40_04400 [Candidatus Peregrinibacteria bacterium]|nr:hypothetical protein [Candidatus Peregrinibacteria bacterium]